LNAVWIEGGSVEMREIPVPQRKQGEALLKLRVAGTTPVELAQMQGLAPCPGIPGREFVASVVESDSEQLLGARVVGNGLVGCGLCRYCHMGRPCHCPAKAEPGSTYVQGCFSEFFTLPETALTPVPPGVPDYDAIMANPLASGIRVLEQVVKLPERVLVHGDEASAPAAAVALHGGDAAIFLSSPHEPHMELLKRHGILRDTGGVYPMVVLCYTQESGLNRVLQRVEPGGRLVVKSWPFPQPADLSRLSSREVTVIGSGPGPLDRALEWLARKEVCEKLSKLRQTVYAFDDAVAGLHAAAKPGSLKVILDNLGGG